MAAKKAKAPPSRKTSAAPAKAAKKTTAVKDRWTKTQLVNEISESTGVARKDVNAVLDQLGTAIERHVKKGAAGEFVMPGLFKIQTRKVPARRAQKNVPNPFRPGEMMDVKARPASVQVKVRPLKKLKDMAS